MDGIRLGISQTKMKNDNSKTTKHLSFFIGLFLATAAGALLSADTTVEWPDVMEMPPILTVSSPSHADFPGLPDPLRHFDHDAGDAFGPPVANSVEWHELRRPEILEMMRYYKYGTEPEPPPMAEYSVLSVEPDFLGGLATKKILRIDYGPPGTRPMILNVYVPNAAEKPVPVIAALNALGNDLIEPGESRANRWDLPGTMEAGIALATAAVTDFAADGSRFADAVIGPYVSSGFAGDWKAIAAWAWGLGRMVDYLETDLDIDPHRVTLTGYSRRGKAALWAAALDERVALVAPHQTGTGGAHPTRGTWGWAPTFRHQFPHWFLDSYNAMDRDGSPNDYFRLPFDQHFAVAAVAPRRVLMSENSSYGANYTGLLAVRAGAAPVWDFLAAEAATGVVLEWNTTSGHSFVPEHWAVIHEAVHALPRGGETGFREWARTHGLLSDGAEDLPTAVLAASDPNGDGIRLLEAYFFGLDPMTPNHHALPGISRAEDGRFRIEMPQRRDGVGRPGRGFRWRGVEQRIEWARDLSGPWVPAALDDLHPVAVRPGPSDATEIVTLEDRRADPGDRVFFRIRHRLGASALEPMVMLHPSDQSVVEGGSVTFTATVHGRPITFFQWERDGEPIPGATRSTLTLEDIGLDDAGFYRLLAGNDTRTIATNAAQLTVLPNTSHPHVVNAEIFGATRVAVVFSEPVEAGTGSNGSENSENYSFSPEVAVTGAELQEDDRTVLLHTEAMQPGVRHQLTVGNVKDRSATPNVTPTQEMWVRFEIIARINFQAETTSTPFGWASSSGELFGDRVWELRYGWLSAPGTSRTRGDSRSPDVRYDSLTHTRDAVWEIELPDGDYDVRVVAGDPSHTDSHHSFFVEDTHIINGGPTSSNRWIQGRRTVSVTDGRLTLSSGPGADNNKICFIEIRVVD